MGDLDRLVGLLGPPQKPECDADAWTEVEDYVGSALPGDFKAFLDAFGSDVISGELVVFHPQGSSPLLARMINTHRVFGQSWRGEPGRYPFRFHPEAGGLVSWGYDYSGDEHFFWPCDPDPACWKVVTNINGCDPAVFDGTFTDFVIAFVERLRDADVLHGLDPDALEFLEPEDLRELAERRGIGPVAPTFEPF